MHEKVKVLAKDVARLRDELQLYRSELIHALKLIQEGAPHSYSWGATSIRRVAERLAVDISVLSENPIQRSQGLGNLIRQLDNNVPSLTCQTGQVEKVHHTWIKRLNDINDIVGGAPHPWTPPAQFDSLVESVEELLKILQELYCEYGTPPKYSTIYFDVAPIIMAYKERLALRGKLEFITLDTELLFNADVTDSDDEPEEIEREEEEYQGEPLPQPLEKAISKESLKSTSVLEVLREHTRVTVLGDAGSGKTETAKAFCQEFNATGTYNIGIHIPLKPFGDGGMDALVRDALVRGYLGDTLPAERPLEKFGSEWNVALVFDGMDECSETRRKECIRSIHELAKLNVRVVILSRERGVPLDQLPAWTTYKLKAFDDGQRDAFLKSRLPGWLDTEHKDLVHEINNQPGGDYLFHNPYFLHVLTTLLTEGGGAEYDYKSTHALSRVRLMREFVERTLRRELTKLGKEKTQIEQYLRPLVGTFAHAGFSSLFSEEHSFTADEFESWYVTECDMCRLSRSEIERLLARIIEILPESGLYSFPHQNIEDFLAAWHLYEQPGYWEKILEGAVRDCTHMLSFLLEMGNKRDSSFNRPLDASLYKMAWSLDPLLTSIGHKRDDNFLQQTYGPLIDNTPEFLEDPWTRGLVRLCLDRSATCKAETYEIEEERGCGIPYPLKQRLRDAWFWYAGTFSENSKERVKRLKRLMTKHVEPWGRLIKYAAEGYRSWKESELGKLPLFDRFAYGLAYLDKETFLQNAKAYDVNKNPRLWALFVLRGREMGYTAKPLWKMLVPLVNQLSFRQLHRLIIKKCLFPRFGNWLESTENTLFASLLSRERLIPVLYNIFPAWMIERALKEKKVKEQLFDKLTPICAYEGVRREILKPEDIPIEKIRDWCQRADPSEAGKLARNGIAKKEDFPEAKLEAWGKSVDVREAIHLAEGGLLTGSDFNKQLRDTWRASEHPKTRFKLLLRRVLPKDDFVPEELSEWLASLPSNASLNLVQNGLVARNDFGSTHIDALRKVIVAGCQDGRKIGLYAPPLLVQLGVVDARDHETISDRAMEQAAKEGGRKVKKLWFDLGILKLDELWRFESECLRTLPTADLGYVTAREVHSASNPRQLRCLSFVVTETLRESLLRVYHPSLGFHFLDLQKVQHIRPEIKNGSVIMAPIAPTKSAEGMTFLPSDRGLGLCTKTADISKLPFPEQKGYLTNEALTRLRSLISGKISVEQVQVAETADLESKGVQFRIPLGDWLEERALKSLQEQLVGKWFTLRVEYLKEIGGLAPSLTRYSSTIRSFIFRVSSG